MCCHYVCVFGVITLHCCSTLASKTKELIATKNHCSLLDYKCSEWYHPTLIAITIIAVATLHGLVYDVAVLGVAIQTRPFLM